MIIFEDLHIHKNHKKSRLRRKKDERIMREIINKFTSDNIYTTVRESIALNASTSHPPENTP